VFGGAAGLEFEWDIRSLGEGAYVLTVEVTDSAGLVATSPPRTVRITVTRPAPVPTEPPPTVPPPAAPATRPLSPGLLGLGGGLFLLLGLFLLWSARQRAATPGRQGMALPGGMAYLELESGERWPILGQMSVGRGDTDISFAGEGVALLHARLVAGDDGYWLYDEGSSAGTLLNGERLGLAGRHLTDGDEIRFGAIVARLFIER
jgi:hypothetical protein